ncbi:hypothetical protein PFISCL1PPCAC_7692, partial [Pristionchus fissidentatus]
QMANAGEDPINNNFEFEEIEKDVFKNDTLQSPGEHDSNHTYGGLMCAQALAAADKTVRVELNCHSFQSNFILRVNCYVPVTYHVKRLFDGRSFATRFVECKQEGLRTFTALIAYQRPEGHSIHHQSSMPAVPPPQECVDFDASGYFQHASLPHESRPSYDEYLQKHRQHIVYAHETRCTDTRHFHSTTDGTDKHYFWTLYKFALKENTVRKHLQTLLFITDNSNVLMAFNKHTRDGLTIAMGFSLSHTVYFHGRNFNANEWMLVELESTNAAHGRGMVRGRIWSSNGELIASLSQESVI